MATHDLTFLDVKGALPKCRVCERIVTTEAWLDDEECPGWAVPREHPLDRIGEDGLTGLQRLM